MAAYIVATTTITDPEKFSQYAKAIAGLSEKHGGEYILRGPVTEVFEGDSVVGERVVVSRFPSVEAVKAYVFSAEYEAGKALRAGAGTVTMRLLED